MKRSIPVGMVFGITLLALASCGPAGYGTINLSVTDAPVVDDDSVTGVYVTFDGVEYNRRGEWEPMMGFEGPQTHNLLELTNGESALLGSLVLPAGNYHQIRFLVAAPAEGENASAPGSWISRDDNAVYDEGVDDPLFVPSGEQTGYKAISKGPFSVPVNGTVEMTADFDLRRAVVERGSTGTYILKPVVRMVVTNQAGRITGEVTNNTENDLVVYAYEAGDFSASEDDDPGEDASRFPNAVTSALVHVPEDEEEPDAEPVLRYNLAFLAAGDYELVIAQYDSETGEYIVGSGETIDAADVEVVEAQTTAKDLTEDPVE